jgi:hypothetical protein
MQQVYRIDLYRSQAAMEDNVTPISSVWVEEADLKVVYNYALLKGLIPKSAHIVGFVNSGTAIAWVDTTLEHMKEPA